MHCYPYHGTRVRTRVPWYHLVRTRGTRVVRTRGLHTCVPWYAADYAIRGTIGYVPW